MSLSLPSPTCQGWSEHCNDEKGPHCCLKDNYSNRKMHCDKGKCKFDSSKCVTLYGDCSKEECCETDGDGHPLGCDTGAGQHPTCVPITSGHSSHHSSPQWCEFGPLNNCPSHHHSTNGEAKAPRGSQASKEDQNSRCNG